jgi:hypothetical protein
MPFRRPVPDPINQDPTTLAIADEQPHARRLGRLGIAATDRGRGLEFCAEVAALLWNGSVAGWDQGTHLEEAAARAGLNLAELDEAITGDPQRHEESLAENNRSLRAAGHWGVPTMIFEGEPFLQDRFDLLLWRMKQRGLEPRCSLRMDCDGRLSSSVSSTNVRGGLLLLCCAAYVRSWRQFPVDRAARRGDRRQSAARSSTSRTIRGDRISGGTGRMRGSSGVVSWIFPAG